MEVLETKCVAFKPSAGELSHSAVIQVCCLVHNIGLQMTLTIIPVCILFGSAGFLVNSKCTCFFCEVVRDVLGDAECVDSIILLLKSKCISTQLGVNCFPPFSSNKPRNKYTN